MTEQRRARPTIERVVAQLEAEIAACLEGGRDNTRHEAIDGIRLQLEALKRREGIELAQPSPSPIDRVEPAPLTV